ncbi:hypothetical protein K438DRAFT_695589 [Mycena galopus ATCC 62051]|nr:hypothetical protein K438DRAFT_695589 [Mycena galopus ATCC 62051]
MLRQVRRGTSIISLHFILLAPAVDARFEHQYLVGGEDPFIFSIHFLAQTIGNYSLYQMDAVSDYYLAIVHRQLPSILGQLVFRLGNTVSCALLFRPLCSICYVRLYLLSLLTCCWCFPPSNANLLSPNHLSCISPFLCC